MQSSVNTAVNRGRLGGPTRGSVVVKYDAILTSVVNF